MDLNNAVGELIAGLVTRQWGQVTPSVYETGRLVTFAPWLTGHERRLGFLLETQRPDGAWGVPDDGYALVPTLSAVEALLSELTGEARRDGGSGLHRAWLAHSAERGLRAIRLRMCGPAAASLDLPDLPAIELIAPALTERINVSLARLRDRPVPGLAGWAGCELGPPAGLSRKKLDFVRALFAAGADVPQKLVHALEIAGDDAAGLPWPTPEPTGTIGAAPAATAAWLGADAADDLENPARWYLETVVAQHGGPVPCGFPLTVFERGWVIAWLVRAGVRCAVPPEIVLSLTAPLGPAGTPAAEGLPADADTTAGALYALALLGAPHRPDPLYAYETDTHFCTWQGEEGASITTNAHVLEAFGEYLAAGRPGAQASRYAATATKVAGWLREQQAPDGSWSDRWHASPLYATACSAIALARFGGPESAAAVGAARRWVLEAQRPDGSWGRWGGTSEETAYAVQLLLLTGAVPAPAVRDAVDRAVPRLLRSLTGADGGDFGEPALWHDKDLYRPSAIVRAGVLAALQLVRTMPRGGSGTRPMFD
ncbi:prenyltransferase/squalene oxidase repeat-containing protein [Actinomadura formosensis]|uniref:prenyltransferase/squalene oxidase repeat-containing protein n=1 Tax=Actinomadura formosensis TaxID=60706 RepID=UPI000B1B76B2|nr:prenyltransferase/squalene oxidase repeat-containing protein [Actinomadura formosensis]